MSCDDVAIDEDKSLAALRTLPNELVDIIFACLPVKDLLPLSTVCRAWHNSASLVYKKRLATAFDFSSPFKYVFEANQPADRNVQGCVLDLRTTYIDGSDGEISQDYATFEFAASVTTNKRYRFKIEADTFIQLCIVGNIIQGRKGGGLEGVAQHMEHICRIKQENVGTVLGKTRVLVINNFCYLLFRLVNREVKVSAISGEEGPVTYEIEYESLHIKSAHLLNALEMYEVNRLTSTALVLRAAA